MRKSAVVSLIFAACLFPVLSWADCASDTKSCDDAKGAAHRCAQTYGFRTELMCVDWNKMVDTACAQAQKACGEGGTYTPASRRNQ
jgi:hypothetical protein